jgi:hypothetical protein
MPRTTILAGLSVLSIAGIAAGVALGRATASDINPAYLQDKDGHFYAYLVPGRSAASTASADWNQLQAQEYQAAQGPPPPPAGCLDCTWPADPTPRHDSAVDRALLAWTPRAEPVEAAYAEPRADPEVARVIRYAQSAPEPGGEAPPAAGQSQAREPAQPPQSAPQGGKGPDGL